MTISVNVEAVQAAIEPPQEITVALAVGQGPAGVPGLLTEQDLPYDPTLLLENALA
jgi:hypothetical protein